MVARGLSRLGPAAAGGGALAHLALAVCHSSLDDAAAVAHCTHVQQLTLRHNRLHTLEPLRALGALTSIDAAHNRLTKALDFVPAPRGSGSGSNSSRVQAVDLSHNRIASLAPLRHHTRLRRLVLDANQLAPRLGDGLAGLQQLQHLSLRHNGLVSCCGLEGLSSLRELHLDSNALTSLAPLRALSSLQVLGCAHNALATLDGCQGMARLRQLDASHNKLRRIEALAACSALTLLTELRLSGNALEVVGNARLHVLQLLPQLSCLDGTDVSLSDKVDAANLGGAAAQRLLAIRRACFPDGELDDGGGAVPPTAAGLKASRAGEERSCTDCDALLRAIDDLAASVPASLALQPAAAAAAAPAHGPPLRLPPSSSGAAEQLGAEAASLACPGSSAAGGSSNGGRLHGRRASSASTSWDSSRCSSAASSRGPDPRPPSPPATLGGLPAIAARLAAGCSRDAPLAQLQLARACYSWVVSKVVLPAGCDVEAGADLWTWDPLDGGGSIFGPGLAQQQLQQVLLPGCSGTFAELVACLLVRLISFLPPPCQLEATQLLGWWKAGGRRGATPGWRLASHNHSWVAVKVNGAWRLLDPVDHLLRAKQGGRLPFFLPPEAVIFSHLPFQACWQLLPQPLSSEQWWALPEVDLDFAASGGQLLLEAANGGALLQAVNTLRLTRHPTRPDAWALPVLCLPVIAPLAAPGNAQQRLCLRLMDADGSPLASWDGSCQSPASSSCCCRSGGGGSGAALPGPQGLVFQQVQQQQQQQQRAGPTVHELWAAFPRPGRFEVQVEHVTELAGGLMSLHLAGLAAPLPLTLRQREVVARLQVVVPAAEEQPARLHASGSADTLAVRWLPQPEPGAAAASASIQLLCPAPGTLLEADRPQRFEVLAPQAVAVAVGGEQAGWVQLAPAPAAGAEASSEAAQLFCGTVVLPRSESCCVAARLRGADGSGSSSWVPLMRLRVAPQLQTLDVSAAPPAPLAGDDQQQPGSSPRVVAARALLAALDADGDGRVGRGDLLRACRRDRLLAAQLGVAPRPRAGDGSLDAFLARFAALDRGGLGHVGLGELAAHLAALAAPQPAAKRAAASSQ